MMNEKITHNTWMSRTKKQITKKARIHKDFQNQLFFMSFFVLSISKSTSGFASQLFPSNFLFSPSSSLQHIIWQPVANKPSAAVPNLSRNSLEFEAAASRSPFSGGLDLKLTSTRWRRYEVERVWQQGGGRGDAQLRHQWAASCWAGKFRATVIAPQCFRLCGEHASLLFMQILLYQWGKKREREKKSLIYCTNLQSLKKKKAHCSEYAESTSTICSYPAINLAFSCSYPAFITL